MLVFSITSLTRPCTASGSGKGLGFTGSKSKSGLNKSNKTGMVTQHSLSTTLQWKSPATDSNAQVWQLDFGTSISRTKQERKQDFMFWACLPCSVALVLEVTRPWFRKAAEIVPHVVSWAHCAKPILCTVSGMQGEALPDWTLPSQGNLHGLYLAWLCFTFASVPVDYTQISLNHGPKCSGTHG